VFLLGTSIFWFFTKINFLRKIDFSRNFEGKNRRALWQVLAARLISKVDVLSIDVEGAELFVPPQPGVELRAKLQPISHRCHLYEVAFVYELTEETIHLPLSCLQGGLDSSCPRKDGTT
jgi:hypothetical protein